MDVVLIRWPDERERLAVVRAARAPRLLLVESAPPPPPVDPLEDWVRVPADAEEMQTRVATLAARAGAERAGPSPWLDDDGLLHHEGRWVVLPRVEQALAGALLDGFGAVVARDALARRAWPGGAPSRNLLDVQMMRFRRRVAPLHLEVRTVRSRGYLLQRAIPT